MAEPIVRASSTLEEVNPGERSVVATINTGSVDRYKTVIVPKGADLKAFRSNPVVLLQHGYTADPLPIGRNLWIRFADGNLVAKTIFPTADLSPLGDQVFRMFQEGFLNAFSVSINPIDYGVPTPAEIRSNPDWAEAGLIFRKWELLEYSVVTVPGNAEAVKQAVARGFTLPLPGWGDTREVPPATTPAVEAPALPPLGKFRTYEQVHAELLSSIRLDPAIARRAAQDRLDLLSGRV